MVKITNNLKFVQKKFLLKKLNPQQSDLIKIILMLIKI